MVLEGKTAIVTGSSSGIGRSIACLFAAEGASVVLADIREDPKEGGKTTLSQIVEAGGNAIFRKTDVSDPDQMDRLVQDAVSKYERLDVMVNNAMTFAGKPLLETSLEDWNRVLAVNLTGMFLGCQHAVRQMLKQEPVNDVRGRLVNITSQHGMIASPQDCSYGVSKAGGVYLTRQIAADYAKDLIVCNAVAPGKIITGAPDAGIDPDTLAYARARTPMPRFGQPDDVAKAALFLASDQATFMTGVNLMVDGGWMAA
ncbi:MAG: SDR family NAD(P)-dependent oxidoreductase [Alphaproteobacteria bacterium]